MSKFVVSRRAFLQLMGGGAVAAAVPLGGKKALGKEVPPQPSQVTKIRDLPPPVDKSDVITSDEIYGMLHEMNMEMQHSRIPMGARNVVVPKWMFDELVEEGLIRDGYWAGTQIHWSAGADGEWQVGGAEW